MELLIALGIGGLVFALGWSAGSGSGRAEGVQVGIERGFREGVREYMRKQLIESNVISGTYNNNRLTPMLLQSLRTELTNNINRN